MSKSFQTILVQQWKVKDMQIHLRLEVNYESQKYCSKNMYWAKGLLWVEIDINIIEHYIHFKFSNLWINSASDIWYHALLLIW